MMKQRVAERVRRATTLARVPLSLSLSLSADPWVDVDLDVEVAVDVDMESRPHVVGRAEHFGLKRLALPLLQLM